MKKINKNDQYFIIKKGSFVWGVEKGTEHYLMNDTLDKDTIFERSWYLGTNKCECSEKDCKNQITIFNTKFNHTLRTDPKNVYTVNSLEGVQ